MTPGRAIWPLLVAVVAGGVYVGTLGNGFTLDDVPLVRDDPRIRAPGWFASLILEPYWPESAGQAGLYRPLATLSFALNRALSGDSPFGFHLFNVLLHMTVSALVWVVVRRIGVPWGGPLLAGLLFAVHPLHVEAVAGVVGRSELLGATFVLLAWLAHRRGADGGGRVGFAVLAGVAYLAALLSKENTVLAPLLFVLDDRMRARRGDSPRAGRSYGAYMAALAVVLALRLHVLGGLRGAENVAYLDNPAAFALLPVRLATAAWVQVLELRLFLFPHPLSSDYSFHAIPLVDSAGDPRLWVGLGWAGCLVVLFLGGWRRHSRAVALGAAIWVLFLLPGSNVFFPAGTLLAERLTYLPSLGGCLILGSVVAGLAGRGYEAGHKTAMVALLALSLAALAILGVRTAIRSTAFRDNLTLALADVRAQPRSAKLHAGAGIFLHGAGEVERAEAAFRRALEIYPGYAQTHFNLGQALMNRGELVEASHHLLRAIDLAPANPRPYRSLASMLERELPDELRREIEARLSPSR